MEKIRQDFFSWLPKAKREIKVSAAAAPAPAPAPGPYYPEDTSLYYPEPSSLPAKQQHIRQAVPPPPPTAAPAPVPSFLAGDGNVLFKIIPVETNGAPLYQIVPTSSAVPDSRPVVSHAQPSQNTLHNTFNTATLKQTFPATSTVHQPQAADVYTPSLPAPTITYTSQVSHPLPPPQQPPQQQEQQQQLQQQQHQQQPLEKASEEKTDIFKKVLNNIDPRNRLGRKTDIDAAESKQAETVFYMSAPDMSKEAPKEAEETEIDVIVIDEPRPGSELRGYKVETVGEEDEILPAEVRELLEQVGEAEEELLEAEVRFSEVIKLVYFRWNLRIIE